MYSDPMPGENLESAEAREKALAEAAAIANGENFNPNIDSETANAFENLSNEVPFAGDNPETPSIENPVTEDKNETPPESHLTLRPFRTSTKQQTAKNDRNTTEITLSRKNLTEIGMPANRQTSKTLKKPSMLTIFLAQANRPAQMQTLKQI